MDRHDWPYSLKSARRKKRLVKKDRDKQLIQLDKLHNSLRKERQNLPMIPLEHPYQKGWKRLFVLRKDVQKGPQAEFYQGILKKINDVKYHYDKSFKVKKHRRGRFQYLQRPQTLREITQQEWETNRLKLSDAEKHFFYQKEEWNDNRRCIVISYAFIEPWRFELKVEPHIIYEVKMHDEVLEQEIKAIDNRIKENGLWPKIHRLTNGRRYRHWADNYFDKPKYFNKIKNQPMYADKEAYID